MKPILIFLFYFLCFTISAQEGDYFLTHYTPGAENIDNKNFDIKQGNDGIIYIANRSGVLLFDGKNWELITTPGAVFSLDSDTKNNVYVGGRGGFGQLVRDEGFNLVYQSLSDTIANSNDIFITKFHKGNIYFLNHESLFIVNPQQYLIEIHTTDSDNFVNLFELNDQLFVSTDNNHNYIVNRFQLLDSNLSLPDSSAVVFSRLSPDDSTQIIGTSSNKLFFVKDSTIIDFEVDDENYLAETDIIDATWINSELLAVGTLQGGVLFVNIPSGKVEKIINYQTGLPDNQVYGMTLDKDYGLWVSHDYGFTRVSPYLPFRNFSNYPGLEGNILSAYNYENQLFVTTSLGIYLLEEVKDFNEIVYYVRKEPVVNSRKKDNKDHKPQAVKINKKDQKRDKGRKGLFGFLKKKEQKEEPKTTKETENKGFLSKIFKGKTVTPTYERRVKRELQSVKYLYKKIDGIDSKTDRLVSFRGKLLASSLAGVFEIKDGNAHIITNEPIRYLYSSSNHDKIFASTYYDQIKVYENKNQQWNELDLFSGFNGQINQIIEDNDLNLWLCGTEGIYKVSLAGDSISSIEHFPIENLYLENSYAISRNGKVYFLNSSGYFIYDKELNAIIRDHSLEEEIGLMEKYINGTDGSVWIFNGKQWLELGGEVNDGSDHEILGLFNDISNLTRSGDNSYWIITSGNQLYKYSRPPDASLSSNHKLLLKEIRNPVGKVVPGNKIEVNQLESSLTFEFIQPDYAGILNVQYHYKLEGLNDNWSEWTENNQINFPYLPPGKYKLHVQTQDVMGQISSIVPLEFKVLPPYWKRWWFYTLEVLIFGTLLILSIRMNRVGRKYRILSRLLAFLTLIMVVEFAQTIAQSQFGIDTSPVINFFIQVGIALVILPVEGLLRNLFFKKAIPEKSQ